MTAVCAEYSVYVGNLHPTTSLVDMEELIYELFLQAGPLEKVHIPYDKESGRHKGYGFVEFQHTESVEYSIKLLHGICLFGWPLNVNTVTQRGSGTTSSVVTDSSNEIRAVPTSEPNILTSSATHSSTNLFNPIPVSNSCASHSNGNPFLKSPVAVAHSNGNPFLQTPVSHSTNLGNNHFFTFDTAHMASSSNSYQSTSIVLSHSLPPYTPSFSHTTDSSRIPSLMENSHIPSLFPNINPIPLPRGGELMPTPLYRFPGASENGRQFTGNTGHLPPTNRIMSSVPNQRQLQCPPHYPSLSNSTSNHFKFQPPPNSAHLPTSPTHSPYNNGYRYRSSNHHQPYMYKRPQIAPAPAAPYGPSHHKLHEARLSSSAAYPPWVSQEVKDKVVQYHLDVLESTLKSIKSSMSSGAM